MRKLAERTKVIGISRIEESLRILEQKPEIISLGAGEPDFPAPKKVIAAAKKFLDKGYTHYSPLQGKIELLEALTKKLKKENKIDVTKDEIIITVGSKEAIFLACATLIDPGDEIIVPDPGYIAYKPIVEFLGGKAIPLQLKEEDNFEIHPERLKEIINRKTKLLIINTPSNPTGTVLSRKVLEEIADIIVENDIYALVDEAYEKLVYDGAKHISLASLNGMKDYVITTQTFSKTFAMCGFRVGYAVAPSNIIKEMKEYKICTTLSPSPFSQLAAVEALKSKKHVEYMRREYDRRRKLILKRLKAIPDIHCQKPKGAFYVFPNISKFGMNSEQFTQFLLDRAKVIVIPGTEFGKYGEGFVRLSYATAYEKIDEAMDRIENVLTKQKI